MGRVIVSKNEYDYHDIKKLYNENKHNEVSKIVKNKEVNHRIRNNHLLQLATEYNHTSLAKALLKLPMVVKNSNLEASVENALHNGNKELVDSFIENTSVNLNEPYENDFGEKYHLINVAILSENYDLTQHLLDKGHAKYDQINFLSIEKIVENKKWELLDNYIEEANTSTISIAYKNRTKQFLLKALNNTESKNAEIALDRAIDKMELNTTITSYMLSGDDCEVSSRLLNSYKDNLSNNDLVDFIDDIMLSDHNRENIDMFKDFIIYALETDAVFHDITIKNIVVDFAKRGDVEMAAFVYDKANSKLELELTLGMFKPEILKDIQRYQKTEKIKDNVMSF